MIMHLNIKITLDEKKIGYLGSLHLLSLPDWLGPLENLYFVYLLKDVHKLSIKLMEV